MQFSFNEFVCNIETYTKDNDYVFRLYDARKELVSDQMQNLVIVEPGYGFICVKSIDSDSATISGYLNSYYFKTEIMVDELLEKIEKYVPDLQYKYVPYHIELVNFNNFIEYNGEY